jgi:hypothetical protein
MKTLIHESLYVYRLWLSYASAAVSMGHVACNSLEAELRAVDASGD